MTILMLTRALLLLCISSVAGWRATPPPAAVAPAALGRRAAVALPVAVGAAFLRQSPARADDKSKYDKKFEKCISECVYEKTKIAKGIAEVEVVSRSEAMAVCKPQCAKSKEQLLLGKPK